MERIVVQDTDEAALNHNTVLTGVVDHLRKLILTRKLPPGQRLVQSDLAARLGVSRTPIREALHQLATEGLVTISPYRGASVASISPDDLEAIYHVRIALESYAAHLVIRNITDEEIEQLKPLVAAMQQAFRDGKADEMLEINRQFYLQLYQATRQTRLYEVIVHYLDLSRQYRRLYFYFDHLAAYSIDEHEQLLKALEQRDEETAGLILGGGLEKSSASLLESLRADQE
jgi:DNA-binding GntR family transcriptional regulator